MSELAGAPERASFDLDLPSPARVLAFAADRFPLAVTGVVGLMAVLPSEAAAAHTRPLKLHHGAVPAVIGHQTQYVPDDQQEVPAPTHKPKRKMHCSTLRMGPNDIAVGLGCDERGDTAEPVIINGSVQREKGWAYTALNVGGVEKCLWSKEGRLSKPARSNPDLLSRCVTYFPILANNKFAFLTDYNCDFFASGLNTCRSGTRHTDIPKETCQDDRAFHNFATQGASPLNADGQGQPGFSYVVPHSQGKKSISYRARIKDPNTAGLEQRRAGAIVIRSLNRHEGWSLMKSGCADPDQLRGGVPTFRGRKT